MDRVKPVALCFGLYMPILILGLLLPRKASFDSGSMGFFERIGHEILYLTGPAETLLNFVLFIPFFFALLFLAPALSRPMAAFVSCCTSAAAELAQSQIPQRVSSWQDFLSNCVGVILALVVANALSERKLL